MSEPSIEEIRETLDGWEFLKELPEEINGFTLHQDRTIDGQVLNIASYRNDAVRCRLDITYTSETFDYVPVKIAGLHQYRDIRYFFRSRERFAEHVKDKLPALVHDIDIRTRHDLGVIIKATGLPEWTYGEKLPEKIGRFELFIRPENAIEYINGSIIFLDYTDFATGDQLVFLYNRFRDEFFAETKHALKPDNITDFDAKSLPQLEALLDEKLEGFLLNFK